MAMTKWFLYPVYPRLANLTLERASVTLADLQGFIGQHKGTLRTLNIKSMRIYGWEATDEAIPNSMLKMVAFLHDEATLEHMSLEGFFFDHRAQRVLQCDPGNTACLLHRVEEYVCRRAELPFKVLRPYWKEIAEGQLKVPADGSRYVIEAEENVGIELTPETDESWSFEMPANPSTMGGF